MRPLNRRAATVLMVLVAVMAVVGPVVIAIRVSRNQGVSAVRARVESYAEDALRRSERTADQANDGAAQLVAMASAGAAPCSVKLVALMSALALSQKYISGFGAVSHDTIVCSSPGFTTVPLGPVQSVTGSGAKVRTGVRFPGDPTTGYQVLERDGFAAIVNPSIPIDVSTDRDIVVAEFAVPDGKVIAHTGSVPAKQIAAVLARLPRDLVAPQRVRATLLDGDRIVSVVTSDERFLGTVAVLPVADVNARARRAALLLVPVGLAAGLILAGAIVFLTRQQLALPAMLRSALRRGEFFIEYQPLVDLQNGRWRGAEALVRWRRPSGEMIRPDMFIPVVEEHGLSRAFTEHVVGLIARDTKGLFAEHPDFHVAINLTPDDLHAAATVALLQKLLADTGAMPSNFTVEATERGFLRPAEARPVVEALRAIGIGVAIDDFGTGYSSLSYLEQFKIDYLKIDKAFVDTLGIDAATSHVIFHVIDMAKALNLQLIAEGVETQPQADTLHGAGVQFAQGWLYARSLSIDDLRVGLTAQPIPV